MHLILLQFFTFHKELSYLIIFFGSFIEGDIILLAGAFLAQQEILSPFIVLSLSFLGITIGDIVWYYIGYYFLRGDSRLSRKIKKISKPFEVQFKKQPLSLIVITKFTYGIHHPLLMWCGSLKMNVKKFLFFDFIANSIWIAILYSLGFISSVSFDLLKKYVKFAELLLLGAVVLFMLLVILIQHVQRKSINKNDL